ncbi:nucleotide exchange factor GrpE [bacterium CG2_30_37_16]|nr:MAG: nucleotide exchange factor GrpE [bacterium CG2_30_37_16]PIP30206.1 MAG: nucleotide exchange factor GrpE [bacterium (Candidatus Howlettbacteria) CG23_combo_of_CG06-09_8_20_14_all_37_9]PJB05100.1 MAG: nucleotide exchange factor GrpE [bacterium (Candidatus Howlettbacteria) CG_4_9_14_3_um_filter_37_10]
MRKQEPGNPSSPKGFERASRKQNQEVEKLRAENVELTNLVKRTQADFVNFKNRVELEKKDWIKFGEGSVVIELLGIMDNFGEAAKHVPEDIKENDWVIGIKNIEKQFEEILSSKGLVMIEAVGKEFDPNFHEAIFSEESDKPEGTVLDVFSNGYMYDDKVLRPAKVKVAKGKEL